MERRTQDRRPSRREVAFHTTGGRIAGQLRDISPTGCRLTAVSKDFEVGRSLTIELVNNISVPGIVRWLEGNEVGVEFTITLHDAMLQLLVAAADEVAVIPSNRGLCLQDQFGRPLPRLGGRRTGLPPVLGE